MNPTPENWQRVTAAFELAIELPVEQRSAFLQALTQSEPSIGREVASLVSFHETDTEDFLEQPVAPRMVEALLAPEPNTFSKGHVVGDFTIHSLLGEGSFAKVYLAEQRSLGRKVAVKISLSTGAEAQTMAHLQHEGIVSVYSVSTDSNLGLHLICMQFVPGATLDAVLRDCVRSAKKISGTALLDAVARLSATPVPFDPTALKDRQMLSELGSADTVAWIGVRLADALAYAHQKGILHLDIKPGNILINPYGKPLLTDFNVSIVNEGQAQDTKLLGGTLNYMSPEQLHCFENGGTSATGIDERSDIYSLGIVLKEMASVGELRVVPELRSVLDRATASRPEDRFPSAQAFSQALSGFLEQKAIAAALPTPTRLIRFSEKSPMWTVGVMVLLPQFIAGMVNIAYNYSRIVMRLSVEQQAFFKTLCMYWNPLIYTVGTSILVLGQLELHRFVVDPTRAANAVELARMRKRIIQYPLLVAVVTSFCWGVAAFFFPVMLDTFRGPVENWVYVHFFVSFLISALIALTYSFLFAQYILIRVVYPRAWRGCHDIMVQSRRELAPIRGRMRFFHSLAGFIPLISALTLLFLEPPGAAAESSIYRALLCALIINGMVGFLFSLRASEQLERTLHALTGSER